MPFTERDSDACAVGFNCCFISDNWISEFSERLSREFASWNSSILHIGIRRLLFTPYDKR